MSDAGTGVVVGGESFLLCGAGLELLAKYNWHPLKTTSGHIYLKRSVRDVREDRTVWTTALFHRELLGLGRSRLPISDHINRDTRDNRLSNLRAVGYSENSANRHARCEGVVRSSSGWYSRIQRDGTRTYLGMFPDEDSARAAHRQAAAIHEAGGTP